MEVFVWISYGLSGVQLSLSQKVREQPDVPVLNVCWYFSFMWCTITVQCTIMHTHHTHVHVWLCILHVAVIAYTVKTQHTNCSLQYIDLLFVLSPQTHTQYYCQYVACYVTQTPMIHWYPTLLGSTKQIELSTMRRQKNGQGSMPCDIKCLSHKHNYMDKLKI